MEGKIIGIVGCGNMAQAMIRGLLQSHYVNQGQIMVSDVDIKKINNVQKTFGITTTPDNEKVLKSADIVILAIKPRDMTKALKELKGKTKPNQLFISIAAGYTTSKIKELLGQEIELARAMPNTSATVLKSATGLYLPKDISDESRGLAQKIFDALGSVVLVKEEKLLDAVTAVSGSGPAYLFYFLEAMIEGAVKIGLQQETSSQLAIQTFIGAADLIKESGEPPEALRKKVTSTGGTTAAAIDSFSKTKLKKSVAEGIKAAFERSEELTRKVD